MTSPINSANFTAPTARDARESDNRQAASSEADQTTATPPRDDSVTLSGRAAEAPTVDSRIQSKSDAQATLDRFKQLLSENPASGIAAHGNIDAKSAAGALSLAA